jgi:hypothetical protein
VADSHRLRTGGLSIIAGQLGAFGILIAEFAADVGRWRARTDAVVGVALLALLVALKRVAEGSRRGWRTRRLGSRVRSVAASRWWARRRPAPPSEIDPNDGRRRRGIALVTTQRDAHPRSFGEESHEIDANDFIALGVANLAAGLSRGSSSAAPTRAPPSLAVGGRHALPGSRRALA